MCIVSPQDGAGNDAEHIEMDGGRRVSRSDADGRRERVEWGGRGGRGDSSEPNYSLCCSWQTAAIIEFEN